MRNFMIALMVFLSALFADIKYRFVKYEKAKGAPLTMEEKQFQVQESYDSAIMNKNRN